MDTLPLNHDTLRDIMGPPVDLSLAAYLKSTQLKKRYLQLSLTQKKLTQEAPELYKATGFADAYGTLKHLPRVVLQETLNTPSFCAWCTVSNDLINRKAHVNLATGHVASHMSLLTNFAVAGALQAGIESELVGILNEFGGFPLPGLKCTVTTSLAHAGRPVQCKVTIERQLLLRIDDVFIELQFDADGTNVTVLSTQGAHIKRGIVIDAHFELNDYDPLLRHPTNYRNDDFLSIDSDDLAQHWQTTLEQGCTLIGETIPSYLDEMRSLMAVFIPLTTLPGAHRSSSSADAFGMLQLSLSDRPEMMAEALIHEYHHNKLFALMDVVPLFTENDRREILYSPWRDDARPLTGLLHGLYVFHAVAKFLRVYIEHQLPRWEWAISEYFQRKAQVLMAIQAVEESKKLTEAGQVLLSALRQEVEELPDIAMSESERTRVVDMLNQHRLKWSLNNVVTSDHLYERLEQRLIAVGGELRAAESAGPAHFAPDNDALKLLCGELGCAQGITINRIEMRELRCDTARDFLGRESVRNPDWFVQFVERLEYIPRTGEYVHTLLDGHIAYIQGDYRSAARHYGECLALAPDNIDVWGDFAFALRHLGLSDESNTFLFHPQLVTWFAGKYQITWRMLEQLMPVVGELPEGFAPLSPSSLYLRFLRWLYTAEPGE